MTDTPQIDPLSDLPDQSVENRVVIVTGSGQGIGRSYAHYLARAGAIPVIAERDAARAKTVTDEIIALGGRALAVETDVSDGKQVEAMVSQTLSELGRIDALINNAAIHTALKRRPFYEIPDDEWAAVMNVNINGYFHCAKAVVPAMREAGYGRIINISSASVWLGLPNYLHYVASKGAIVGMTNSMSRELGEFGITVNAVLPGQILTEVENPGQTQAIIDTVVARQAVKRSGLPGDVMGLLLYLISPASGFVTGQGIVIDGGMVHR
jgi:NAD(P)-dependent dehydrogenase (short-subunit alcohol dehydrogenase family)